MDLSVLLADLVLPSAYPFEVKEIIPLQTHISAVFLAGEFAYKVKKPVQFPFLDFSTLEKRKFFCEEEVRINARLAPDVYLGVVPVAKEGAHARFEGTGKPVEYAVKMRRLPAERNLETLVKSDVEIGEVLERLARRLAEFYASTPCAAEITACARFEVVAKNARDNFAQAQGLLGTAVHARVFDELQRLTEAELTRQRELIDARADRGLARETHGDLHLDHVYYFPDQTPPNDLAIIDAIEFNPAFRHADPLSDIAFLVMDLLSHGRLREARLFSKAFADVSGDHEGVALLPFYASYRALVRAKVEGFKSAEIEVTAKERDRALWGARRHYLLALRMLAQPQARPALVLCAGTPGTGKSTLARDLEARAGFTRISSDEVRKELAGLAPLESGKAAPGEGIYGKDWSDKTYSACLQRAERLLFEGRRVLVDATFISERRRVAFVQAAKRWGVPLLFLTTHCPWELIEQRVAARTNDPSDADVGIARSLFKQWEAPGPESAPYFDAISTAGAPEEALKQALDVLRKADLWT